MTPSLHKRSPAAGSPVLALVPPAHSAVACEDDEDQLQAIALNFQRHGGLVSCESLAGCIRQVNTQPLSMVARWIVSRSIVVLPWQGRTFVPLFQFTPSDWQVHADVTGVLNELREVLDDRDLALWFVTPNAWLSSRRPLACLGEGDQTLLQAARADRFVARG